MRFPLIVLLSTLSAYADVVRLQTLADVRALSHGEASTGIPVQIEGTVIYVDQKDPGIIVYDGTASCWLGAKVPFPAELKLGSRIRATGQTDVNSFFPNIGEAKAEVLGQGHLPPPIKVTWDDLFSPEFDSQWIEVEAVVIGSEEGGLAFTLVLDIDGTIFKVDIPAQADAADRAAALMQRRVKLSGIIGTVYNESHQMTGRHFFAPSFDQIVPLETGPLKSSVSSRKTATLLQKDHHPRELTRIAGVVTQQAIGGFYLRDETASTLVYASGITAHPVGSKVEVDGFAAIAPFRPVFRAANVRKLGNVEVPKPIPVDPSQGIRPVLHNERVTIECEFLAQLERPQETVLQCRSGDSYFEAWLPGTLRYDKPLAPYDVIQLTGIYEVTTSRPIPRMEWADSFRVQLSGPEGLVLLREAPWWTLDRVLVVLSIAVAIIFLFYIWNTLLRRRVLAQRETITRQVECGIIKDERERIARELHDTLEQDLTGLSMQLENATAEVGEENQDAHRGLTLVHRMLQRCRIEARASVRNLRSPDLLVRNLPAAMKEALEEQVRDTGTTLEFTVEGTQCPLRSTTQNHLLRIAREVLTNALRHGNPSVVRCCLTYSVDSFTLDIEDNGNGFNTSEAPPAGHFGLIGIRERANKIQAQLCLTSNIGKGTRVLVFLSYSSPEALPGKRTIS